MGGRAHRRARPQLHLAAAGPADLRGRVLRAGARAHQDRLLSALGGGQRPDGARPARRSLEGLRAGAEDQGQGPGAAGAEGRGAVGDGPLPLGGRCVQRVAQGGSARARGAERPRRGVCRARPDRQGQCRLAPPAFGAARAPGRRARLRDDAARRLGRGAAGARADDREGAQRSLLAALPADRAEAARPAGRAGRGAAGRLARAFVRTAGRQGHARDGAGRGHHRGPAHGGAVPARALQGRRRDRAAAR